MRRRVAGVSGGRLSELMRILAVRFTAGSHSNRYATLKWEKSRWCCHDCRSLPGDELTSSSDGGASRWLIGASGGAPQALSGVGDPCFPIESLSSANTEAQVLLT